jgi:hypothetical protein
MQQHWCGEAYICQMSATGICGRLRSWGELYPDPSAPAGQNAAARASEDERLGRFAGLNVLDRDQVIELIGWKFGSMAHRKALAMRGISPQRRPGRDGGGRASSRPDCTVIGIWARL